MVSRGHSKKEFSQQQSGSLLNRLLQDIVDFIVTLSTFEKKLDYICVLPKLRLNNMAFGGYIFWF